MALYLNIQQLSVQSVKFILQIHHTVEGSDNLWSIAEEELMERITESSKAGR